MLQYMGKPVGLDDYIGWLTDNFDPSISWKDLEWIRDFGMARWLSKVF